MLLQTPIWDTSNKLFHPFKAVLLLFMAGWVLPKALLLCPACRKVLPCCPDFAVPALKFSGNLVLDALLETLKKKIPTAIF